MSAQLALFTAADQRRVAVQYARVWEQVRHGGWVTLAGLSARTGDPEASVSARLREFRREGHQVERRRRRAGGGQWEYRVTPNPNPLVVAS